MNNLVAPLGHDPHKPLPVARTALAAGLTVPVYVVFVTPAEKVKVQLQVQGLNGTRAEVTGPISCIRNIIRHEGPLGLLSGYVPTTATRLIGIPFYIVGYQINKWYLMNTPPKSTRAGREIAIPMVSGFMAGLIFWPSIYPFDIIETKIQAAHTKILLSAVVRDMHKSGGVRAFYKGLGILPRLLYPCQRILVARCGPNQSRHDKPWMVGRDLTHTNC